MSSSSFCDERVQNSKSNISMSMSDDDEEEEEEEEDDQHSKEEDNDKKERNNKQNSPTPLSKPSKRKLESNDMNVNKNESCRSNKKPKLWGEKDEIALLEGLLEFQSSLGKDGLNYRTELFEFVVGSIKANVSRKQVIDKVLFLRKKFEKNLSKTTEDGKDREFSNPHEYKLFLLSRKIWDFNNDSDVELVRENEEYEDEDLRKVYPFVMNAFSSVQMSRTLSQSGLDFVEDNLKLVSGVELKKLNREWKELSVMKTELCLRKIGLLRKQMRMVVDAIKSSSS